MSKEAKLFGQFPPVPTGDWIDLLKKDLKGADFGKRVVWNTDEGFDLQPFYRADDIADLPHIDSLPGKFPFVRGKEKCDNSWLIRQDIEVTDLSKANEKALYLLNRGVDSLGFSFSKDEIFLEGNIDQLVDSVFLESIELNLCPEDHALELLRALTSNVDSRGIKRESVHGSIETDPLGRLMVKGRLCVPVDEELDWLAKLTGEANSFKNLRTINVNGANLINAGATAVQELAMAVAMGSEYMSALTTREIPVDNAAKSIGFTFGIGSNYFMEISKLRAARILWAMVVRAFGPENNDSLNMYQHAVTSCWNKTLYDPYVNMLRTQTEAMSATLGGVDSLTVLPFDSVIRKGGDFSGRIARNQQLLLREESYFGKVADPAAGSYYIEKLTASVAEHAWDLFTEIEKRGGFISSLQDGFIQSLIKETAERKIDKLEHGKTKLLGANIFPDHKEKIGREEKVSTDPVKVDLMVEPVRIQRAAEEFEKLRLSTDNSDGAPKVFLIGMGNLSMRKARARFSADFFAVAGYEIIDSNGFETCDQAVAAAQDSGAEIAVICSSDEEYGMIVPEIRKGLNKEVIVVVAGEPACKDDLQNSGIEFFISLKTNILETLKRFNELLGIK